MSKVLPIKIPTKYKKYWKEYKTKKTLLHITTLESYKNIIKIGYLEPRDPSPKYWAGMIAIFLSDPKDKIYKDSLKNVIAHISKKGKKLVRLHIVTSNRLFRCLDPERTFQVVSLESISVDDIKKIEYLF